MPGPGPIATAAVRWTVTADGPIRSTPVVSGGVLYVAADSGSLYALDLVTGRQQWLALASHSSNLSTPDVVGGMVLVGTADVGPRAFDAKTGNPGWSVAADGPISGAPADVNGTVVFATEGGSVIAADATTGAMRWTTRVGAAIQSSVALSDGVVVVGDNDGSIEALGLTDGAIRWKTDVGEVGRVGTPAIDQGRVFASTGLDEGPRAGSHIVVPDLASGKIQWRYASPTGDAPYTPALSGGGAFVTSEGRSVVALDAATGTPIWTAPTDGPVEVVPAVAGTAVYLASNGGSALAFDATTGAANWQVPIRGVPYGPTVAGGLFLIGTDVGELDAIGETLP